MKTVQRKKITPDSRRVEELLRTEFPDVKAYQYNSASIRVRVTDPRFEGKTASERDAMVSPILAQLPEELERDILMLLMVTPKERQPDYLNPRSLVNLEFDDPGRSRL